VNHVVVRLATVELRMFLSEAPYWSRAPRQGFWTSQRRLAINVISDGKLDIHIIIILVLDILMCVNVMLHQRLYTVDTFAVGYLSNGSRPYMNQGRSKTASYAYLSYVLIVTVVPH
jgi:hypothetical protein